MSKLFHISIIFLFLSCFCINGQDEEKTSSIFKTAEERIRTGKYQLASESLKKHLESNPEDFNSRLLLLEVSEITGDKRELLKQRRYLKNLFSSGKAKTAPALTAVAKSLWELDPNGALMLLQEAHKKDKEYIEAYIQAGNLCYDKYAWGKAKKEFEKALEISPLNPEALTGLAMLDLSSGLVSRASKKIKKALKANPDSLSALTSKAYISLIEDDFQKCEELLKKGEKINPNSIDVLCIYAAMHEIKEEPDRRDEYIKRALKINPTCVNNSGTKIPFQGCS